MSTDISTQATNTGNFAVNPYVIPAIGNTGTYNLASPYNTLIDPNVNYTCMAIRTIGELIASNKDPYTMAYKPAGISETIYNTAVSQNLPIISLVSDGGNWVYVPANYILSVPLANGVNYQTMGLNIILGLMQQDYDLTNLIDQLEQTILATIGINVTVQPVQLSNSLQVTIDQANTIEAARTALITNNDSAYGLYMQTLNSLNNANAKIQALENYIMANKTALNLT